MAENSIIIEVELQGQKSEKVFKGIEKDAIRAGEKAGKNFSSKFQGQLKNLTSSLKGVAVAAAAVGSAFVLRRSIQAAVEQEDAVNRLTTALKVNKDFSDQSVASFKNLARELQATTRFGDEVILNQIALAKSFGATNEQAANIARIAPDLAEAFNTDLESATRNIAKTLGGFAGELGEVIPALKTLTTEQLQAGAGIRALADEYGGTAQQRVKTFSGATDQLSNAITKTLEGFGNFIVQNPLVIKAINLGTEGFFRFADALKTVASRFNRLFTEDSTKPIDVLNKKLSETARQYNLLVTQIRGERLQSVVPEDENVRLKILTANLEKVKAQRQSLLEQRAELSAKNNAIAAQEAEAESIAEQKKRNEKLLTDQLTAQLLQNTTGRLKDQANLELTRLQELRDAKLIGEKTFQEALEQSQAASAERFKQLEMSKAEASIQSATSIAGATKAAFASIRADQAKLAITLRDLSINGFGKSFQAIGAALANGENANEAFVNSVKATASEAASAFGDYYIKLGIARTATGDPTGPAIIAGGAALKVLAGALGASAGGTQTTGGGFTGGGFGESAGFDDTGINDIQDVERAEPQQNINIVVEGSLVRQEELGTFITETLNESFGKQGVTLTDARIA